MSGNKRVFFDVEASGEKLGKIVMEVSEIHRIVGMKILDGEIDQDNCSRLRFEGLTRAECPIFCFLLAFWFLEASFGQFILGFCGN